ncbi:glutathione transferase GstA [Marinobacter salarius]|jgi:glutathione S-transferase|uniref:Glutathione S-transferase GST-6.0 n=1 Tax=Marinobacter salarius TaxID=1420917 RepID=A0A1W6KCB0_9GAMM|nr:glutathione transferase GstA [Marinobacter salarius]ARM85068.1 glutathione S-transferase GST-6.0 [Marinobacter salarius]
MKLYFKPGACSLATHIVLRELGIDFTLEPVDTQTQRTESGIDYKTVNPKGYVPALDTGRAVLTEGAAILQYLAESTTLIPDVGTLERARLQEHLNYIASELHKAFGPFFKASATDEQRAQALETILRHFDYLESLLDDGRAYLVGDTFTVADAYLFVVCSWAAVPGIDLKDWPFLNTLWNRMAARPSVKAAMLSEGLVAQ